MLFDELFPILHPLHDALLALVEHVLSCMLPLLGDATEVVENNLLASRHREYGSRGQEANSEAGNASILEIDEFIWVVLGITITSD